MKKILIAIVVVVLLVVVVGVLGVGFYLNDIVKTGIEKGGPQVTGTAVTVERVSLSPFSGSGSLTSLVVANPEGFQTDGALKVGQVSVKLEPGTLTSDVIVINDISIDGVELTYELGAKGSNIGIIQKNIEKLLSSEPSESETKVIIDRFSLKGGTVRLSASMLKGQAKTIPLPALELKDIGRKSGGQTASEAAGQILQFVMKKAAETAAQNGFSVPGASGIKDTLKGGVDKLKGLIRR